MAISGNNLGFTPITYDDNYRHGNPLGSASDIAYNGFKSSINFSSLVDDYGLTGTFRDRGQNAVRTFQSLVSNLKPGAFDSIHHFFGKQSSSDKIFGELHSNLLQELEELRNLQEEQEYNSPIQQVARNSAAGINSDLAGNVDPGEASENTEFPDPGFAFRNAESGLGDITSLVTGALSIYSSLASIDATKAGIGLTKAQTRGVDISNMTSEVDFTDKENQFFKKVFNHIHTSKEVDDLLKGNTLELDVPSDTALISAGLRTKKQRDRYRAFQEAYVNSFQFAIEGFQNQGEYLGAESDVAHKRSDSSRPEGNPFDSSFVQLPSGAVISRRSDMHEGYISGLRTLAMYERDLLKLNYQFNKEYLSSVSGTWRGKKENAQNKFDYEYFNASDGGLKAQLEAAQNRFTKRVQEVKLDTINKLINADDPFSMCLALQALGEAPDNTYFLGANMLGAGLSSLERGYNNVNSKFLQLDKKIEGLFK